MPVLPGIRQYVPKRTTHGRKTLFDCNADGVMMHKEKMTTLGRPGSTPSSQQGMETMGRSMSSSLLRPHSALTMSKSVTFFEDEEQPSSLKQTTRRKQQTINSLKALEPLEINRQRVALQSQLRQLEQAESTLNKENMPEGFRGSRSASALNTSELPKWVKLDREVLRWYAYGKETVPESANETFRIRKFIIYFYLVDGTIRINEPKIRNSGLPSGDVYERSVIVRKDGNPYGILDFKSGAEVEVCSRVYRIVDCDAKTKKYFKDELNTSFGTPEKYPDDPFVESQKFSDQARMKNPTLSRRITNEALLGGRPGLIGHKVTKSLDSWIANDGKTLKFECLWDDSDHIGGTKHMLQLVYYLEDDTIQLVRPVVKGGGNIFPVLIKRGRIPRDFTKSAEIPDNPLGRNEKKYYVAEDLKCGSLINVFGREIMLCKVNKTTFDWYKTNLGISQHAVDVEIPPSRIIKHSLPPYNGWGSEADSLTSCMHLVPKPVKRDMLRFLESQGKTMRFKGKFSEPKTPADAERRFVFTFYLEDLTCSIFEPAIPNSGLIGGQYLERGEYKRSIRQKTAEEINPHGERDNHPLVQLLRVKMQQYLTGGKYMMLEAFKHFGGGGQGNDNITVKEFKHGCMMCGMPLTMREARTLFALYDEDDSGHISFQEFVDGVMESDYGSFGSSAATSTARWIRPADFAIGNKVKIQFPRSGNETPEFEILGADGFTLSMMEMNPQDFPKSNVEYIIKELATKLAQFNVNVRTEFKLYDQDRTGSISDKQFKALLNKWSKDLGFVDEDLTEADLVTLVRNFDEDGDGSISYNEFCDALTAAPIAFRNEVDENHLEKAERRLYNEFHDHPIEDIKKAFEEMDEHGDGHITMYEFHRFLEHHGIEVSDEEAAAIMLHYDKDVKGYFNYNDFISIVSSPHFLGSAGLSKTQKKAGRKMQSYKALLAYQEEEKGHVVKIEEVLKKFTRYFFRKKGVLKKRFLSHDVHGHGVVNKVDFIESLDTVSGHEFPKRYLDQLCMMLFPDTNNSACPYTEFMDVSFRADVQSFNGLIQRRCNLHDKSTWGSVVTGLDDAFDNHF